MKISHAAPQFQAPNLGVPKNRISPAQTFAQSLASCKTIRSDSFDLSRAYKDSSLAPQDIDKLAKKYDPEDMTQQEYNSFLEYLREKGEITETEQMDLGYTDSKGMVSVRLPKSSFQHSQSFSGEGPFGFTPPTKNVKQWVVSMSSLRLERDENGNVNAYDKEYKAAFTKMSQILDRLLAARE